MSSYTWGPFIIRLQSGYFVRITRRRVVVSDDPIEARRYPLDVNAINEMKSIGLVDYQIERTT